MRKIGVDVDGVVADLYTEWLGRYNRDYDDKLTVDDLTVWGIHTLVKPECGTKIFDYLAHPDLYEKIEPIGGARSAVYYIRQNGDRPIFVTSNLRGMTDQKWDWLVRHGFIKEGHYCDDLVVCHDKSLINVDILIDDSYDNVKHFGGMGILFGDYPHSRNKPGLHTVARNWREVLDILY